MGKSFRCKHETLSLDPVMKDAKADLKSHLKYNQHLLIYEMLM